MRTSICKSFQQTKMQIKTKLISSNHITQRLKMKISTLFSAFVAVYGQVSMQTYDTCKIRRWQNFKGILEAFFDNR